MNEQLLEIIEALENENIQKETLIHEYEENVKILKEQIKVQAKKINILKNMMEAN